MVPEGDPRVPRRQPPKCRQTVGPPQFPIHALIRPQVIAHRGLAEIIRGHLRRSAVKIVFHETVRATFQQQFDHCQMSTLRRQMQSRDSLPVGQPTECGLLVDVGAMIQ